MKKKKLPDNCSVETKLVRGGRLQSDAGETSEALFLNSSFSYDTAEEGENALLARLKASNTAAIRTPTSKCCKTGWR